MLRFNIDVSYFLRLVPVPITLRFTLGTESAIMQTVIIGTVFELHMHEQRGRRLVIDYLGPLLAPLASLVIDPVLVFATSGDLGSGSRLFRRVSIY